MSLDLGGTKKKQNEKSQYSIIEISLFKPTKKKYPEIDYEDLRRNQLKEGDSSGEDERFHDKEAMEMVRRLEAKYGNKRTKKGKKVRFGTEDDFIDKGAGYDLEDAFIDDSEAYDELIPSTMDTARGGFYVNRGKLEFKSKSDEAEDSDVSEGEPVEMPKSKGKKRVLVESDEEAIEEGVESGREEETAEDRHAEDAPTSPVKRMAGAPPTKKMAGPVGTSTPAQRAAQAIKKKRLAGLPPTLNKAKLNKRIDKMAAAKSAAAPTPASSSQSNGVANKSSGSEPISHATNTTALVVPTTSTSTNGMQTLEPGKVPSSPVASTSNNPVPQSTNVAKKGLPPLTDTLSKMLADFKTKVSLVAGPGPKKRLTSVHLDMAIRIEEQCVKDGFTVHEKARVIASLADFCGLQKASINYRIQRRKDEIKQAASGPARSSSVTNTPSKQTTPADNDIQILSTAGSSGKETGSKTSPVASSTASNVPNSTWTDAQMKEAMSMVSKSIKEHGMGEADVKKLACTISAPSGSFQTFKQLHQQIIMSLIAKKMLDAAAKNTAPAGKKQQSTSIAKENGATNGLAGNKKTVASGAASSSGSAVPPTPPKHSLFDAVAKSKSLDVEPTTTKEQFNPVEASALLDSAVRELEKAVSTSLTTSDKLHQMNVTRCAKERKPPPAFVFHFTDNVMTALKKSMDIAFRLIQATRTANLSSTAVSDSIYTFVNKRCLPLFKGKAKMGKLFVEYCRRHPDCCGILRHPPLQKDIREEKIDITRIEMHPNALKSAVPFPSKSTSAGRSQDDDIQFLDERGNLPSSSNVPTPAVSTPLKSADKAGTSKTTPPVPASPVSVPTSENLANSILPEDLANIQKVSQQLSSMGTDPQQILMMQQTMVLQAMQKAQESRMKGQQQASLLEKEKRKKEKEEQRLQMMAKKKAEQALLKQQAAEEKRKRIEEEKQQRAAEKARKAAEEKERRMKEQAERERKIQEANERRIREEQEKRRLEEERERLAREEAARKAQEEAEANEAKRLAKMRENDRREEEERVRVQRERAAAARAATLSAAPETKPLKNGLQQAEFVPCEGSVLTAASQGYDNQMNGGGSTASLADRKPLAGSMEPTLTSQSGSCAMQQQSTGMKGDPFSAGEYTNSNQVESFPVAPGPTTNGTVVRGAPAGRPADMVSFGNGHPSFTPESPVAYPPQQQSPYQQGAIQSPMSSAGRQQINNLPQSPAAMQQQHISSFNRQPSQVPNSIGYPGQSAPGSYAMQPAANGVSSNGFLSSSPQRVPQQQQQMYMQQQQQIQQQQNFMAMAQEQQRQQLYQNSQQYPQQQMNAQMMQERYRQQQQMMYSQQQQHRPGNGF